MFGISVIVVKNPVFSVLFLIGLFVTISIYLELLGLTFMGLSYLLIYVGAVSILFLFILMLLNIRISELITEGKNSIPLAIIIVLYLSFSFDLVMPYCIYVFSLISNSLYYFIFRILSIFTFKSSNIHTIFTSHFSSDVLGNVDYLGWDNSIVYNSHITSIGNILYGDLLILLIVLSFILLLAMVGAILVTIKRD